MDITTAESETGGGGYCPQHQHNPPPPSRASCSRCPGQEWEGVYKWSVVLTSADQRETKECVCVSECERERERVVGFSDQAVRKKRTDQKSRFCRFFFFFSLSIFFSAKLSFFIFRQRARVGVLFFPSEFFRYLFVANWRQTMNKYLRFQPFRTPEIAARWLISSLVNSRWYVRIPSIIVSYPI